ncbi:hypothetical protein [Tenacibaculum halocynthiae]|uniref:hypothetical protein n=1 Tax=Tenacibaculum halocynthiae TaxID=1254437 RepID=UPI0038B45640
MMMGEDSGLGGFDIGTPSFGGGDTGFNGGTGISIDIPDFDFGGGSSSSSGSSSDSSSSSSGGGFFSNITLNGLLGTLLKGGATWAQIEAAKNGKNVYVQGSGGQKENITPMLISKLEEQAKAQQTTVNSLMTMMQAQMVNNNTPKEKKDKTLLYVGIGVGTLALGTIVYMITNKKKK